MKIYSKKRFISGVFFLLLFILSIITLIISINNNKDFIYISKNIITSIIALFIGLGSLLTSIDKKANMQAEVEEQDERGILVGLHAASLSNKIMFYLYYIMTILFIILWYKSRVDELLIPVIIFGIMISINFISNIISIFYYEHKI